MFLSIQPVLEPLREKNIELQLHEYQFLKPRWDVIYETSSWVLGNFPEKLGHVIRSFQQSDFLFTSQAAQIGSCVTCV